ncbi:RCC1 and BTB domain-containing protein 1 [Acromyrmex echinatior]|uniref:RCC1 and BTB domain-containing protein 1 n=1 Tax=Acromyrmex echinatior TaxID=103372 RepID=F4WVC6_ACREC|nr:RCC1 and BTB domain-containing protein 1 [Acromyrmex echinatior]
MPAYAYKHKSAQPIVAKLFPLLNAANAKEAIVGIQGLKYYWRSNLKVYEKFGKLFDVRYWPDVNDWTNIRIVKTSFHPSNSLVLTDDGKIYYLTPFQIWWNEPHRKVRNYIRQINIEGKITHIACGENFYVVISNNDEVYEWGLSDKYNFYTAKDKDSFMTDPYKVIQFSGSTVVKVVCGHFHTLVLTDKGKVYAWGANYKKQLKSFHIDEVLTPFMINIPNVKKISDIAIIEYASIVKSSEDQLVYIRGELFGKKIEEFAICEYTNIFDICNLTMAQSPISIFHTYTDEENMILSDLEAAFNDNSSSCFTIEVGKKSIYVHKYILKIRSSYFANMFQFSGLENKQRVIKYDDYSYIVYRAFFKYLYTGVIDLLSLENELELLKLSNKYCMFNLEKDCIRIIKKKITIFDVFYIKKIAMQYGIKVTDGITFFFSFYYFFSKIKYSIIFFIRLIYCPIRILFLIMYSSFILKHKLKIIL